MVGMKAELSNAKYVLGTSPSAKCPRHVNYYDSEVLSKNYVIRL